jgi:spermidine/putrescine transport system substrate-binding protein
MLVLDGYAPQEYLDDFKQIMLTDHNVRVEFDLDLVSEPEEYLETLRRRGHEIICPTHNILKSPRWPLIQEKLVLPLRLENIPNFQKIISSLRDSDFLTEGGNVYAAPFLQGTYGLAYNSDLVSEPDSWKVLWDSEYAKQYAVSSDYPEVNIYITALSLGVDKNDLTNVDVVDTPEFRKRLKELAQNAKRVWHGSDTAEVLSGLTVATSWGFAFSPS